MQHRCALAGRTTVSILLQLGRSEEGQASALADKKGHFGRAVAVGSAGASNTLMTITNGEEARGTAGQRCTLQISNTRLVVWWWWNCDAERRGALSLTNPPLDWALSVSESPAQKSRIGRQLGRVVAARLPSC